MTVFTVLTIALDTFRLAIEETSPGWEEKVNIIYISARAGINDSGLKNVLIFIIISLLFRKAGIQMPEKLRTYLSIRYARSLLT